MFFKNTNVLNYLNSFKINWILASILPKVNTIIITIIIRVKAISDQKNIFATKVGFWCSFVSWIRIWVQNWPIPELRVARPALKIPNPFSKTVFTSIEHAEYAYILTQNKISDLMGQKIFESAHAKFENQWYLKMRGRNQNFE